MRFFVFPSFFCIGHQHIIDLFLYFYSTKFLYICESNTLFVLKYLFAKCFQFLRNFCFFSVKFNKNPILQVFLNVFSKIKSILILLLFHIYLVSLLDGGYTFRAKIKAHFSSVANFLSACYT